MHNPTPNLANATRTENSSRYVNIMNWVVYIFTYMCTAMYNPTQNLAETTRAAGAPARRAACYHVVVSCSTCFSNRRYSLTWLISMCTLWSIVFYGHFYLSYSYMVLFDLSYSRNTSIYRIPIWYSLIYCILWTLLFIVFLYGTLWSIVFYEHFYLSYSYTVLFDLSYSINTHIHLISSEHTNGQLPYMAVSCCACVSNSRYCWIHFAWSQILLFAFYDVARMATMWWLQLGGPLKTWFLLPKEPYIRNSILQKTRILWRRANGYWVVATLRRLPKNIGLFCKRAS